MRSVSIVLMLVLVAIASVASANDKPHYDLNKANDYFEQYIKDYNRVYKDSADRDVHFHAFVKSLKQINKFNSDDKGATYDINKFSDRTKEELAKILGLQTTIEPAH